MILKIRQWCEGIIITIIICIIIECLIPNGNNKKYAKVVIGIYIMYITFNPILNLLNYDLEFENIFSNVKYEETYSSIDYDIKDIYILGIEENIKEEVESLGYKIENVEISVDSNYENIEKIELKIKNEVSNEIKIEEIVIGEESENNYKIKENTDYSAIIKHLKENYFLEENQIFFK